MAEIDNIQQEVLKQQAKRLTATELEIVRIYRELNKQLKSLVMEFYEKHGLPKMTGGVVDSVKTNAYISRLLKKGDREISRILALQKQVAKIAEPLINNKDELIEIMNAISYQDGFYYNGWATDQTSGLSLKYPILDTQTITAAVNNPFNLTRLDRKTDKRKLINKMNQVIRTGIARGDSIEQMARELDIFLGFRDKKTGRLLVGKIGKKGATYDALRIARTELTRMYELGRNQEFLTAVDQFKEQTGGKLRMQLSATLDDRTRPQSASMDGAISNEKGQFQYPDGNYYIPHNTGHPQWDINDREVSIQIFENFTPKIRRTKEDGIIPNMTFKEWAEKKGLKKNKYGQKYVF